MDGWFRKVFEFGFELDAVSPALIGLSEVDIDKTFTLTNLAPSSH